MIENRFLTSESSGTRLVDILRRQRRARAGQHRAATAAQTNAFAAWVARGGFRADREPVDLSVWKYLRPVYERQG